MELLTLTHYNFIFNNTMKIGFMTKFDSYANRKTAALLPEPGGLVAEYSWLIPAITGKLDKYELMRERPKILASEEFYTNGQGMV